MKVINSNNYKSASIHSKTTRRKIVNIAKFKAIRDTNNNFMYHWNLLLLNCLFFI